MKQANSIVIADDHPLFREALGRAARDCFPGVQIHPAGNFSELLAQLRDSPAVDMLILDLTLPDVDGFAALAQLRAAYPQLPVVVVSALEEPFVIERVLMLGAAAVVPKSAAADRLRAALLAVRNGRVWSPLGPVPQGGQRGPLIGSPLEGLTPQQKRVLALLSRGLMNKQIAAELGVAEATIKSHLSAILRKLKVRNRTQAVVIARSLGVDADDSNS